MDSGDLLGDRYRLLSRLGTGGMSVVWLGRDERLEREVAIKVMTPVAATDARMRERLRAEARVAARLHHAHVVDVRDCGESPDGDPYVVMEVVRGENLASVLTDAAVAWPSAVRLVAELAAALAAAHRQGIVHRDVAPSNVILTPDGVKLVDFGISALVGEADAGPDDVVMGTPAYLAPERLERASVSPAADVYALGVLLYRLLAGRLPWDAATITEMLDAHYSEEPAPLPHIVGLPAHVVDLCFQCLAKDPADRPTAATVARVLSGQALDATTVLAPPLSLGRRACWPSRTRAAVAAMVVLAVLGTVAATAFGRSGSPGPEQFRAHPSVSVLGANPVACRVRYDLRSDGDGRFRTAVTVANTGSADVHGWQLEFDLPGRQRIVKPWSANMRQSGQTVLVTGAALTAGAAASTGFDGEYMGANPLPVGFRLNGSVCEPTVVVTDPPAQAGHPAPDDRATEPTQAPAPEPAPAPIPAPAPLPIPIPVVSVTRAGPLAASAGLAKAASAGQPACPQPATDHAAPCVTGAKNVARP